MPKNIVLLLVFLSLNAFSNEIESRFIRAGLVNIASIDTSIRVDLVNSNPNSNFFSENFYDGLQNAYLQKETAVKLAAAQKILKKMHPEYSLMIMDAARPNNISRKMFSRVEDSRFQSYVADPEKGSMHNYGVAVDVTIFDISNQRLLDMGFMPFYQSRLATLIRMVWIRACKIKPNKRQLGNRELLKSVMTRSGFYPLSFEWWHFEGLPKEVARSKYKMIP